MNHTRNAERHPKLTCMCMSWILNWFQSEREIKVIRLNECFIAFISNHHYVWYVIMMVFCQRYILGDIDASAIIWNWFEWKPDLYSFVFFSFFCFGVQFSFGLPKSVDAFSVEFRFHLQWHWWLIGIWVRHRFKKNAADILSSSHTLWMFEPFHFFSFKRICQFVNSDLCSDGQRRKKKHIQAWNGNLVKCTRSILVSSWVKPKLIRRQKVQ